MKPSIASLGIFFFAYLLVSTAHSKVGAAKEKKPNVLLITIDDLNDWVGCLSGHPQSKTPNIDKLAARGVLFTNAHCQAPICNPSRVSLFTGLRPSTTGIYVNGDRFRKAGERRDAVTMPKHFESAGYRTFGTGKLFHASGGKEEFQSYGPAGGQGPLPKKRLHIPPTVSSSKLWDWGVFPGEDGSYNDIEDADWAVKKLTREDVDPAPMFLGVGFYRPHVPFYAPEKWFLPFPFETVKLPDVAKGDRDDLPPAALALTNNPLPPSHDFFLRDGNWQSAIQAYLACVAFTDDNVGKIIAALDSGPHADDTWIVLLSDHGFHLGEKERWAKQSLWERSTRVPLIVVPPKNERDWARGKICSKPVELLAIYPTLIDVSRIGAREGLEGKSLVPLLKDPDGPAWNFPAFTTYKIGNHTIRTERWRYIRYADGSEELYDHESDPNEWENLAARKEHAERLAELRTRLEKALGN